MPLEEYKRKRHFSKTPEPEGKVARRAGRRFVIQKHAARRLHYDFRLELDGVLKSWAVPKGPSLDPSEKRLAVHVEDHPIEYGDFEGVIPEGEYGGGTVVLWDRGEWEPLEDADAGYRAGKLKFRLDGEKLHGGWTLVRMRGRRDGDDGDNWLLIKERDDDAKPLSKGDILSSRPESVASGRSLEEIRDNPERNWRSKDEKRDRKQKAAHKKFSAALKKLRGAKKARIPEKIEPELASLAEKPPEDKLWFHEIKLDGYRMIAFIDGGNVTLQTRKGLNWTGRFPEIAKSVGALPVESAVLDGEIVALQRNGASNFSALQQALTNKRTGVLVYYVFDLLYLEGYDIRGASLEARKKLLHKLLDGGEKRLQYLDHIVGNGPAFYEQICENELEGSIAKRSDRPYRSGRQHDWLKIKCRRTADVVIGGFTKPNGARSGLGALVVGQYDQDGRLVHVGRVGTGFTEKTLKDLYGRLTEITRKTSPFANLGKRDAKKGTTFVEPKLVAHLEYGDWSHDQILRHAAYQGLREDTDPRTVRFDPSVVERELADEPSREETPVAKKKATKTGAKTKHSKKAAGKPARRAELTPEAIEELKGVRLTSPNKVLYHEQGLTKLDLVSYYVQIADWVLPHVVDRPLSLVRCPDGDQSNCFYQKHASAGTPDTLHRVPIEEKGETEDYLYISDLKGLLSLVQIGVLEIHPWGSKVDKLERPDRMFFDLDPDEGIEWDQLVLTALRLRERLEDLGLESFVKTSGGKGLHVVVPLDRRTDWTTLKEFSRKVVQLLMADFPREYTDNMSKRARQGRIYIDFQRNNRGSTAVAPYSTRSRNGAPVSMPLFWEELNDADIRPNSYNVVNTPDRLAGLKEDPWAEIGNVRQSITAAMKRKVGM